jgi:hypothetical protein
LEGGVATVVVVVVVAIVVVGDVVTGGAVVLDDGALVGGAGVVLDVLVVPATLPSVVDVASGACDVEGATEVGDRVVDAASC